MNADTLGWPIARSTGKSVAAEWSERIWSCIGTERKAYFTVDFIGTPSAGGGLMATLRDMARLAQLMLDNGLSGSDQIVPPAAIARIRHGGERDTFANAGYPLLPGWSYRSIWWISNDDHGAHAALGVHGQTIWIDPKADMVMVRFASNPLAANAASDPTSLAAYRAVADHLMAIGKTPLLGQEWLIEDIAGNGVIDNSRPSLLFFADGRRAGRATCSGILGSYKSDGQRLAVAPAGTTVMACPEAPMNQERKLLKLLPPIKSYRIDKTGALMLATAPGRTIMARRTPP